MLTDKRYIIHILFAVLYTYVYCIGAAVGPRADRSTTKLQWCGSPPQQPLNLRNVI